MNSITKSHKVVTQMDRFQELGGLPPLLRAARVHMFYLCFIYYI